MGPKINLLDKVNRSALLKKASALANGSPCNFVDDPIQRSDQIILKICFPHEGKTWAAKIPSDQEWPFYEIMVQPLQFLEKWHPGIPAPRVHGYVDVGEEGNGEDKVGVAYILLDWIDGRCMQPWSLSDPPVEARHHVLNQIADLMLEMLGSSAAGKGIRFYGAPAGTPENTPVSTTIWLTESIDRPIRRNLRQKKTPMVIDNLIQRSMVSQYVMPEHENSYWAAIHPDLHSDNIVVDDEWNIIGLIDWNLMFAQPLQKGAVFPKLIEHIPGAAPPDLPAELQYLDFTHDKDYLVATLAEKEGKQNKESGIPVANLVKNSTQRAFFEMSHNFPDVHTEFARRHCQRTKENIDAAKKELEIFLSRNPEFSHEDESVIDVERELNALAS
ncbi:hypothetical protein FQN54_008926 [Arachnomyces sp. PD_36]|nr:hypothetical protein FQN54_008926 [Arachnomyces sp. PD_36]